MKLNPPVHAYLFFAWDGRADERPTRRRTDEISLIFHVMFVHHHGNNEKNSNANKKTVGAAYVFRNSCGGVEFGTAT